MYSLLRVLILLIGIALAGLAAATMHAAAQVFPYSAPSAPEFDDYGNIVERRSEVRPERRSREPESAEPAKRSSSRKEHASDDPDHYRTVRPFTPSAVSPPVPPPPVQTYKPPAVRTPAPSRGNPPHMAATNPQATARPDCSGFPMMIARAQSEGEMQASSRQYLTCLLQNGWNMEQARTHVINTIESTFRLAR